MFYALTQKIIYYKTESVVENPIRPQFLCGCDNFDYES
jgi:hypothetical protein